MTQHASQKTCYTPNTIQFVLPIWDWFQAYYRQHGLCMRSMIFNTIKTTASKYHEEPRLGLLRTADLALLRDEVC